MPMVNISIDVFICKDIVGKPYNNVPLVRFSCQVGSDMKLDQMRSWGNPTTLRVQ